MIEKVEQMCARAAQIREWSAKHPIVALVIRYERHSNSSQPDHEGAKEQRYELDTLDQKCLFFRVITVQIHTFLTALRQSLQAVFEEMGFEHIQHVQHVCHRLLVGVKATTQLLFMFGKRW